MNILTTALTNQFFLLFAAIAVGMLIGKIKIGNFSLGVSGGIFSGIIIGYFVTSWAHGQQEGMAGFAKASGILKSGVIAQPFFTFFLFLFLVAIGLRVGKNIGMIFKKYGAKFIVIGAIIPIISMLMTTLFLNTSFRGSKSISDYETIGMYAGAMTSTPAYGTALDAASGVDVQELYANGSDEAKAEILDRIDPSLKIEDVTELSQEQISAYQKDSASAISLGYTVAFPVGVLVIVVMISLLPKIFRIDIEKEREIFNTELEGSEKGGKDIPDGPLDFIPIGITVMIGLILGNIHIPLGPLGDFSLGGAGGILLTALILSHIGKIVRSPSASAIRRLAFFPGWV